MEDLYAPLLELAQRRKSCRHFSAEPVSDELVGQILAVASCAPFASGRNNWKIAAVRDPQVIATLSAQVRDSAAAICAQLDAGIEPFFRRYAESFTFFEGAPVLLIPYCRETSTMKSMLRDNVTPEILAWEHDNLTKSLSCAGMMILLAAESLGLGACYMTGPLLAGTALNATLGLRDNFLLGAVIPVGYPAK